MLSVAPDQDKLVAVDVVPDADKVGAVGAVVSAGGADVVTLTVLLFTETFPAASFALTLNV